MASLQERLDAASNFLLQSPPGQVNDVFADIRALVGPEDDLETAILPALKQLNQEQFTLVDLSEGKLLLTPVSALPDDGQSEERYIDPRGKQTYQIDHLNLSAHSPLPLPVDSVTETLRSSLDTLLASYVANHYNDGAAAVYALDDARYPAPPPPAPAAAVEASPPAGTASADHGIGETGSIADDVEGTKEDVAEVAAETAEKAEEALPADEGQTAQPDAPEVAEEEKAGVVAEAQGGDEPVEAVEEKAVEVPAQAPEPVARPSRLFGLYFVGNKYNPSNYWTGRWRSSYDLDYETGSLTGTAKIQVHYYEQGNVQLTTTLTSSATLSPSPSAEEVIAAVKTSDTSFQRQLNSTYGELSDESFRGLRRALPKTREKANWVAIAGGGARIGRAIGGGQ